MAPLDFPSSPVNGQTYNNYVWDSSVGAWLAQGSTNNVGDQIAGLQAKFPVSVANGGTGATTVADAQDSLRVGLIPIAPSSVTYVGGTGSTSAFGTMTITGCTSVEVDGVFSSSFKNYRFMFKGKTAANANPIFWRGRTTTNDSSSNYYSIAVSVQANGTVGHYGVSLGGNGPLGNGSVEGTHVVADFLGPNTTERTTASFSTQGHTGSVYISFTGTNFLLTATQYTGFQFGVSSGSITGTLTVYGYND